MQKSSLQPNRLSSHQSLDQVANINGGGLSVAVTGKYTSVRHERAKIDGKLTAGEAAKYISKELKLKISAKELVSGYKLLYSREPEWHHAGFYKASGRKSTMGRTFFFDDNDIDQLINDWSKVSEKEAEIEIKKQTIVKGFYYTWDHDYSGNYGKKRNYKVLATYEGSELGAPRNFTSCDHDTFLKVKEKEGKKYFGWDEPSMGDFA